MTASHLETLSPASSFMEEGILADIRSIVKTKPETTAVRGDGSSMTYKELWDASEGVARYLHSRGIGYGDVVALSCGNSPQAIATLLGIQLTGAAYAPADPSGGSIDLDRVARVTGAKLAFVDRQLEHARLEQVRVGESLASHSRRPLTFPGREHPAYVICTSGSTGEPRAVVVNHGNLCFSTRARREVYPNTHVFLLLSPIFFDSSVAGIWGTLTIGGTLIVPSDTERRDPPRLVDIISDSSVTHTLMIPSLYRELLHSVRTAGNTNLLESLASIAVAGETLPESLIQLHFDCLPTAELVNEYGPTETTVWATFRRYTSPAGSSIGRPVPGVLLRVCDDQGNGVGLGEVGELHIGGPGVSEGYLGNPQATAESFVNSSNNSERWYKTGDLVRLAENIEFEFISRRDRQVKIRGQRIQLGAVECAVDSLPAVRQVVADATPDDTRIRAHVVIEQGANSESTIRSIRSVQPSSSRPDDIHLHETLPRTANGKVDITALRESVEASNSTVSSIDSPGCRSETSADTRSDRDRVREAITTAWLELLEVSKIEDDRNFFDAGGNSMLLIRLQNLILERTRADIPMVALFQHTTIRGQVQLVLGLSSSESAESDDQNRARRARAARARRKRLGGMQS